MPATCVHFLIRGTLEHVTFYGERDFAGVFKLRMRRGGGYAGLYG